MPSSPRAQSNRTRELAIRIVSGVAVVGVTILFAYVGGWAFTAFVAFIVLAATMELWQLLRGANYQASLGTALLAAAAAFIGVRWPQWIILAPALCVALLASLAWQLRQSERRRFGDWASSFAGGLYLGWTGGHLAELRELPNGVAWLALALVTVWLVDSGAYAAGSLFGRNKLSPRISPGKTWEGYAGGIVAGTLGGIAVGAVAVTITPWVGGIAGFLVGVLSTVGDLIESMIKREAHVKNSGQLIPGHGGVFDRVDSLLWAGVVVFYVYVLVGFSRGTLPPNIVP